MKKYFFAIIAAAICLAGCSAVKENSSPAVTVSMSAEEALASDGTATIAFNLSEAISTSVKVTLAVSSGVQNGRKAIAADAVKFDMNPVIILMNKTQVHAKVTVSKSALKKNAQLCIVIEGAEGAKVKAGEDKVYINWTGEDVADDSSEDPSGDYGGSEEPVASEDPSDNPSEEPSDNPSEEPSDEPSDEPSAEPGTVDQQPTAGWKVTYDGVQSVEFEFATEDCAVFTATGHKGEYAYFLLMEGGWFEGDLGGDPAALLQEAEAYLVEDSEYYECDILDLIYSDDPANEYFDPLEAGEWEIFVIGMTEEGKATGHWTWTSFTVEAEPPKEIDITGPITKVASWQAEYLGRDMEEYTDEDTGETETYISDYIRVPWAESTYFYFDMFEKGDLDGADPADVISDLMNYVIDDYESYVDFFASLGLEADVEMTDWFNDAEYDYASFDDCEISEYDIFIFEIDDECNPTGRYNICSVNITGTPEYSPYSEAPKKAVKRSSAKARKAVPAKTNKIKRTIYNH